MRSEGRTRRLALPRWQFARWRRDVPGVRGFALAAVMPGLYFAPLLESGLFETWRQGATAVTSVGVLVLALTLGRDAGAREPTEFWMHQKGHALADWALARWGFDLALAAAIIGWWTVWLGAAALYADTAFPIGHLVVIGTWLVLFYVIVSALLLAIGATGTDRISEFAVVLLMLAMLEPLIVRYLPDALARAVWALPPVHAAANARASLILGAELQDVLIPALRVLAWLTATIATAVAMLNRRIPLAAR